MARTGRVVVALLLGSFMGLSGCSTIEGHPVRWPWSKPSMLSEEYTLPPENDGRYLNPPTYPKHTMTPELKRESNPAQRPGFSGTTGMGPGGRVGGMPR